MRHAYGRGQVIFGIGSGGPQATGTLTRRIVGRTQPRHLIAIVATAIGAALTGCAAPEPETGPQEVAPLVSETTSAAAELFEDGTAEPYTGPYDADFAAQIGTYPQTGQISDYEGVEVTLTGVVHEVINPVAVAITDPQDPSLPPLLVVLDDAEETLVVGDPVAVSGTVHAAYNVPTVEENLGEAPDEDVLAHYDGEPFVLATAVNSPAPTVPSTTATSG